MHTLLLALLLSQTPERVGVLFISRDASGTAPVFERAARTRIEALSDHAVIEARHARKTVACNLGTFSSLGLNPGLCGVSLPQSLDRLIVVESELQGAHVTVTMVEWADGRPQHLTHFTAESAAPGATPTAQMITALDRSVLNGASGAPAVAPALARSTRALADAAASQYENQSKAKRAKYAYRPE